MKVLLKFNRQLSAWVLLLMVTTHCSIPNAIRYQYDHAAETKNYRWEHRAGDMKLRSPLVYVDQTFLKQLYYDQSISYTLYDVVVLHENAFRLDNRFYLLLDNQPISLKPKSREDDNWRTKDTKHDEVLLADSTKLSVVTGYQENNYRITRLEYNLTTEVVEKIRSARLIQFQYYSGSHIITISLSTEKVNRLKKLLVS